MRTLLGTFIVLFRLWECSELFVPRKAGSLLMGLEEWLEMDTPRPFALATSDAAARVCRPRARVATSPTMAPRGSALSESVTGGPRGRGPRTTDSKE